MQAATGGLYAEVIEKNATITNLDVGYNKLSGANIVAFGQALCKNKTLKELKIHRQESDYGDANELELIKFWAHNTTLSRMYATLHNRLANNTNTKAEVRNKEIAKRIEAGKNWDDLNPDPEVKARYLAEQEAIKKAAAEAEALANAPITEKVESTGGPYTYKELTCDAQFRPDDVDPKNRELSLNDAEFEALFKMDKEAWGKLAGWKKAGAKKEHKLH